MATKTLKSTEAGRAAKTAKETQTDKSASEEPATTRITTFTISRKLQGELIAFAAYNKVINKEDSNISRVVRAAVDYYLKVINYSPKTINLTERDPKYIAKVADLLRNESSDSGKVSISVELTESAYATITSLGAYNRLLGIKPDTASAIAQNAARLYLESSEQDYKKFV